MILSHNLRDLSELFFYISYVEEHQMREEFETFQMQLHVGPEKDKRKKIKKNEQMPKKAKEKEGHIGIWSGLGVGSEI